MRRHLLTLLACPSCRVGFDAVAHAGDGQRIESGYLRCPRCAIVVPVLDGLVMFTEPLLHAGLATAGALSAMALRLFGTDADFAGYRRDKRERGVLESYAAFAPFNESTRSLGPLLPHATASLQAGDAILDTWCRTGWSGEWLAGRFPGQQVVSLWEGNSSVLGYRGFRHLLGSGQRADNLDIVFCSLDKPLPFRDGAFGLVHAYDSLHRYGLMPFAGECLRVARPDAAILFPHLHLGNSEPEPFFERGCEQRHGRDYRQWLQGLNLAPARRAWVLSEAAVFEGPAIARLVDDAETSHYNGMVAILPDTTPQLLPRPGPADRYVASPLFRFHLGRGSARVGKGLFEGAVGHLLQRHPVYEARLPPEAVAIGEKGWLALLLATIGQGHDRIESATMAADGAMAPTLDLLCAQEIVLRAPLSEDGHRLQRFHANQLPVHGGSVLAAFWSSLRLQSQPMLQLAAGEGLDGDQLLQFSSSVCALLHSEGLRPGDVIQASAAAHPLLMLAGLAAASAGYRVALAACVASGPSVDFVLADDHAGVPAGLRGMSLGLAPGESTLLARLRPAQADMLGWLREDGRLGFDVDGARAECRPAELIEGLDSLSAQIEAQLWLHEGQSPFVDLLVMLVAWQRGECLRAL